ncbi:MAG: hypothetical protein ACJ8C4_13745 [Gemmataceae bacterium]
MNLLIFECVILLLAVVAFLTFRWRRGSAPQIVPLNEQPAFDPYAHRFVDEPIRRPRWGLGVITVVSCLFVIGMSLYFVNLITQLPNPQLALAQARQAIPNQLRPAIRPAHAITRKHDVPPPVTNARVPFEQIAPRTINLPTGVRLNEAFALTASDPRDRDGQHPVRVYGIHLGADRTVTAQMKPVGNNQTPLQLRLENDQGQQVAAAPEKPGREARLSFSPPAAGEYRLIASANSEIAGKFSLTVKVENKSDVAKDTK